MIEREGRKLTGYPALVDQGRERIARSCSIPGARPMPRPAMALLRLLRRQFKDALQRLEKQPPGFAQTALMLKTAIPTDALAGRCREPRSATVRLSATTHCPDRNGRMREQVKRARGAPARGRRERVALACRDRG